MSSVNIILAIKTAVIPCLTIYSSVITSLYIQSRNEMKKQTDLINNHETLLRNSMISEGTVASQNNLLRNEIILLRNELERKNLSKD